MRRRGCSWHLKKRHISKEKATFSYITEEWDDEVVADT